MKKRNTRFLVAIVSALVCLAMMVSLAACAQSAPSSSSSAGADASSASSAAVSASSAESSASSAASGSTSAPQTAVSLQIFAANSLQLALPEVQALYTKNNPGVSFAESQFLGSGDLVTKLAAEPAAADILICASKSSMDDADKNGSIDAATRYDMFANDLVVVTKAGSGITFADLSDVTKADFSKIAIGESGAVPAGAYANQALNSVALYSSDTGKDGEYDSAIADKIVQESSVGNVAKTVANGDAQIGFVYSSDVYRFDGLEVIYTVPDNTHKAIIYPGAVVAASANGEEAKAFLDFCTKDAAALAIFSKYGFEVK